MYTCYRPYLANALEYSREKVLQNCPCKISDVLQQKCSLTIASLHLNHLKPLSDLSIDSTAGHMTRLMALVMIKSATR